MKVELVNLLDASFNRCQKELIVIHQIKEWCPPYSFSGEFALCELTESMFFGARTIGVPARVACQILSPSRARIIVGHTIREIREAWTTNVPSDVWLKPFDPSYTEMLPSFFAMKIPLEQMRLRQYEWFLSDPPYASAKEKRYEPDIERIGEIYLVLLRVVVGLHLSYIPDGEPIGVALSGGADSAIVATVLCAALAELGRKNTVYCFTLAIDGGGSDFPQAQSIAFLLEQRYGPARVHFVPIKIRSDSIDVEALKRRAALTMEEYHARDVECGMASILLYDAVAKLVGLQKIPPIRYDFNGDGGNELFRDYPTVDEGYGLIPLEEVLRQPAPLPVGIPEGETRI